MKKNLAIEENFQRELKKTYGPYRKGTSLWSILHSSEGGIGPTVDNENFDLKMEALNSSTNLDELLDFYLAHKELYPTQAFEVLSKQLFREEECIKAIVDEYKPKTITTYSDAGSLKVGNDDFSILIPNGYGDGETYHTVVEAGDPNPMPADLFDYQTVIDGKFNIYEHDCSHDCSTEVCRTLKGRYGIYSGYKWVVFKEWK